MTASGPSGSYTPFRGSNSAVECHLAKVDVESSNLFSRSEKTAGLTTGRFRFWGCIPPLHTTQVLGGSSFFGTSPAIETTRSKFSRISSEPTLL